VRPSEASPTQTLTRCSNCVGPGVVDTPVSSFRGVDLSGSSFFCQIFAAAPDVMKAAKAKDHNTPMNVIVRAFTSYLAIDNDRNGSFLEATQQHLVHRDWVPYRARFIFVWSRLTLEAVNADTKEVWEQCCPFRSFLNFRSPLRSFR
jgi:hypothetical protein